MNELNQGNGSGRALRSLVLGMLGIAVLVFVFAGGVIVGAVFTPGMFSGQSNGAPVLPQPTVSDQQPQGTDFDIFWEVWNIVEDRFYYDLPDQRTRVYGAINGMLESLGDPYTAFVPPEQADILREDNSGYFEGIGAYVAESPDGGVHIIRVFEGGPADSAGVRAGDRIVAVGGVDITGNILDESLLLIRGPANTDVTLTIVREGVEDPLEITVTRARLEIPTIESRMLENNIGYVALFEFNSEASARLEEAVQGLLDEGATSLILDLRDNPGGFLDESIAVADLFLPEGVVLIERDVDGGVTEHTSDNGDIAEDIPLVVLVNGNSASASEIVAGALRDRGRATLIGETTFGKGSVQLLYDLSDGSQLRVTFANWYTPDDISISGQGIEPDIFVETPQEPGSADVQLERAIQFL